MAELPSGTVTFLFTDIEGSTRLWQEHPDAMPSVIARHDALLQQIIEEHHGVVFRTLGDAVCSAFSQPSDAILGAVSAQRELLSGAWDGVGPLHVRMAIHTGPAEVRDTGYVGHTLNRVARILSAGHGGQILLSRTVRDLVGDALPSDISLCDLGRHRLKDLAQDEHIFGVAAPGLPIDFPPLVTLNRIVANLPVQPTRFIGRDRERADLCRLLGEGDVRLVTLTGPGGTGKTRLALQAAGDLVDRFPEGAFFVPLSAVIDPGFVARQIASAVGVRETGSRPLTALLRLFFGDRKLLLLLDNFEQVISAASLVGELLAGCPSLRVLVTSREALHLAGEQEYPVPTLTLPEANGHANGHSVDIDSLLASESVALFLDRARTVKPDFTVTPDSAGAVVDIVRRVDGLPLAIELAAARIRVFPPHALARRLDRRLQILTGGPRDQPERQQTLRGAIDWSFRLLDDPEQVLFRRLSVFAGGCFLDAAEAICALEEDQRFDITSGLVSLVEKSLLRQEESLEGEPRFAMLETIREYAAERLQESGEAERVRRRHAEYYVDLAEAAESRLLGPEQRHLLDRLDVELENLRAVFAWSEETGDADPALRLAGSLGMFAVARSHWSEALEWSRGAIALHAGPNESAYRPKALQALGSVAWLLGHYAEAQSVLEESIALSRARGDVTHTADALHHLGYVVWARGDSTRARELFEEALELAKGTGETWIMSEALHALGLAALSDGDFAGARRMIERGATLVRADGNAWWLSDYLNTLGDVARGEGAYGEAQQHYLDALEGMRASGLSFQAGTLHNLGYVALRQGAADEAEDRFREALEIFRRNGDQRGIAECLAGLGGVAAERGDGTRAARAFGAASRLLEEIGADIFPTNRRDYEVSVTRARTQLDEHAFNAAWAEGHAMSPKTAIDDTLGE